MYPALRAICVAGCRNHEMFLELLPRLSSVAMPDQVLDCLDLLASCLSATPAARVHWHKMYTSNLPQSAQLIQYLGESDSLISSDQSSCVMMFTTAMHA